MRWCARSKMPAGSCNAAASMRRASRMPTSQIPMAT
jgi:hypothetical protein